MTPLRTSRWAPFAAVAAAILLAATGAWWLNLRSLGEEARRIEAALKKLTVGKQLPPSEQVMSYLTEREQAFERRYQQRLASVTAQPPAALAAADPQLYFQQRFHELQRNLERLAAAQGADAPELLGFPKELPPPETVPRLLAQIGLIQESLGLVVEQNLGLLKSVKVEDPETVLDREGAATFLVRVPVRLRQTASLPQLMTFLGLLGRAQPLMDVQSLRLIAEEAGTLDVELRLARYLATNAPPPTALPASAPQRSSHPRPRRHAPTTTDDD